MAIATPPGRGGIGVVRLSGGEARRIAEQLTGRAQALVPRHATLTRILDREASPIASPVEQSGGATAVDLVIATFFPAPHSYTGEDVVELSAHGSPIVLQAIVRCAVAAGARLAEPGEFTLRAFLHERIDLVQAEAVADLIDAVTPLQARVAFDQLEGTLTWRIAAIDRRVFDLVAELEASIDFPEEGYHFIDPGHVERAIREARSEITMLLSGAGGGRLIREGRQVAIVGKPNVGKSTLFNALLGADRAIVTAVPGTTRDLVTDTADLDGIPVTLIDTAGIRETVDEVEHEGVARARRAFEVADLVVVVLDASRALDDEDRALLGATAAVRRAIVANKIDLGRVWHLTETDCVTALTKGIGLADVRTVLRDRLASGEVLRDAPAITNARHIELLRGADESLARAESAAREAAPEEFVLADLQGAREALEEITGQRTSEDLLASIFDRFCIGK
ncbi:MAG: tRNA uridine-5-carboxymethylaminomethyl(34) synthesis GTPase MnmE [Acidobacteria bacterium]|nr:tRNA uridine-5-carboxymethylaminomethyl(34) synthesis GTPase MnmE [Acidobacteriota bacterium]